MKIIMEESFYKRFGLETTLEDGKRKFVNRVKVGIFDELENSSYMYFNTGYSEVFEYLCIQLGEDSRGYYNTIYSSYSGIDYLTGGNFNKTLRVLEFLLKINIGSKKIDKNINSYIQKSYIIDSIDLGIRFESGIFYPKGNDILDEELINKTMTSINGYTAEKYYYDALHKYLKGDKKGATASCYEAVEKLCQELLKNERGLKENKKDIQKIIGDSSLFSEYWSKIIENTYNYYCDSRHTKKNTDNNTLDDIETEAIIYQTGLIINLLINKHIGKQ